MKIVPGKSYRIKGNSEYFRDKYETPNPIIIIEDTDKKVFGGAWHDQQGNPTCILFSFRVGLEFGSTVNPFTEPAYYGKIKKKSGDHMISLGELVYERELESCEQ